MQHPKKFLNRSEGHLQECSTILDHEAPNNFAPDKILQVFTQFTEITHLTKCNKFKHKFKIIFIKTLNRKEIEVTLNLKLINIRNSLIKIYTLNLKNK